MSSIGKRFVGGQLVPRTYRAISTRPAKVRRYKKGKVGLRGLLIEDKPEIKEWEYSSGLNQVPQYGSIMIVNQVPQGTNYNNRVGNHIRALNLRINWIAWAPPSTYTNDDLRMLVVWDTQANGAATVSVYGFPTTTQTILNSSNAPPITAFKNTALAGDRFIILKEHRLSVQSVAPAATTLNNANYDDRRFGTCYIDLRGQNIEYNTTTGGIPTTGAIYVCWVSANNNVTQSLNGQFTFNAKMMFTDI